MNLDHHIVMDLESGTFCGASGTVILDTRKLTPEELELLNEGSDAERSAIGNAYGYYLDEQLTEPLLRA